MGLDDSSRNRQPYAHAMAFRRHEGLKQLRADLRRDPRSGIGDADFGHAVLGGRCRNNQFADGFVLHRLDRVANEVEQNLLNLNLVRQHIVEPRSEGKTYAHALVLGADQRQRARFFDKLLDVLDAPFALAAGHEIA